MFLRELYEAKARRVVAVMPGGFHPFHPGHKSLYDWAVKTFGKANVYVAATNDTKARPFPFEVKKKLAAMAGVPEGNFMQVKSPFNNREYAKLLDNDTALVFVRSDKDKNEQPLPDQTKKNGEPGYLRTYTGKDLNTSDEMGYMAYGPTINFNFSGMQIKSASELRATWPEMSDEDKLKAAKLMYGNGAEVAVKLLDQALGDKEAPVEETQLNEAFPLLIPALAAAVRIGAPMVGRLLSKQVAKKAAKTVAKNTGKVASATGKAVIRNPGKTALAVGSYEVYDSVSDAMEWLKELDLAEDLIKPLAQAMVMYALPVAAVLAILYGGKKLYDYMQDQELGNTEAPVGEIMGFATRSPKRTTRTVKRKPPEEDSVQDKLKKRRAMAAKGNPDAFKSGAAD